MGREYFISGPVFIGAGKHHYIFLRWLGIILIHDSGGGDIYYYYRYFASRRCIVWCVESPHI